MTLEEFKTKKRDIECKICDLLSNFEDETGARVERLYYTRRTKFDECGMPYREDFNCEIELKF